MGSSNGVTRGQLRPYFSGRTPPFILVGTLIVLIIFGFSYWSLNSQYGDLQTEVQEFQDQLRGASQKRLEIEKQVRSLQEQLDTAQKTLSQCQNSLKNREEELTNVAEQVRDAAAIQSQLDSTKVDLDRCQEEKTKIDGECTIQKEHFKQTETENGKLKNTNDELQQKIKFLEGDIKKLQEQGKNEKVPSQVPVGVSTGDTDKGKDQQPVVQSAQSNNAVHKDASQEMTLGNPDIGMPVGNDVAQSEGNKDSDPKLEKPASVGDIPAEQHKDEAKEKEKNDI